MQMTVSWKADRSSAQVQMTSGIGQKLNVSTSLCTKIGRKKSCTVGTIVEKE